jgi:hypothetical protein
MYITRRIFPLWIAVSLLASCSSDKSATEVATKAADEASALVALKDINTAQADFIRRTRRYAQSTKELITDRLMSGEPKAEGYTIQMIPSPDAVKYTVTATPQTPDARHFFTDETGTIRSERGKPATAESPGL